MQQVGEKVTHTGPSRFQVKVFCSLMHGDHLTSKQRWTGEEEGIWEAGGVNMKVVVLVWLLL